MESTQQLHIAGMACNGCRNKVRTALLALEGVEDVKFLEPMAYDDTLAEILLTKEVPLDSLKSTIEAAGYSPL